MTHTHDAVVHTHEHAYLVTTCGTAPSGNTWRPPTHTSITTRPWNTTTSPMSTLTPSISGKPTATATTTPLAADRSWRPGHASRAGCRLRCLCSSASTGPRRASRPGRLSATAGPGRDDLAPDFRGPRSLLRGSITSWPSSSRAIVAVKGKPGCGGGRQCACRGGLPSVPGLARSRQTSAAPSCWAGYMTRSSTREPAGRCGGPCRPCWRAGVQRADW